MLMLFWDLFMTPPGELSSFLSSIHMPTGVILGLMVIFRFFPTMKAELKAVGLSMKNRGLTSVKQFTGHPLASFEYVLVPLLLRILQIADQLAVSAVARGAECPGVRKSYYETTMHMRDWCFLCALGHRYSSGSLRWRCENLIEFKNVSFQYEGSEQQIWNVNLSIAQENVWYSQECPAAGKTTLTRLMNGLAPSYFKGSISGSICIDDRDITGMTAWEIGTIVGSVFQNPKKPVFSSELVGEVAFGCENHGFSREAIQERTDKSIETFSFLNKKKTSDVLSSGESSAWQSLPSMPCAPKYSFVTNQLRIWI